ncbi:MAG: lactate utilization protein [Eubacteriales bacterium]
MKPIDQVVDKLNANGFIAKSFSNMDEAKSALLELIPKADSVGTGTSMTIKEGGILEAMTVRGQTVYSSMLSGNLPPEETAALRKQALQADWFLSGTNAVTTQGELINIDGYGNRVAGLIFGPKKVVVLVGQNKITKSFNAGIKRIKTEACGKNARRVGLDVPCAEDDQCHACDHPRRMCNTVIWNQRPNYWHDAFYVYIIEEDWGF